ncbi:LLM class flavin-dependent oxidoreductase [Saccharopolyspora gloriosae]|uniref:Luciferase family oxidoreductase group 1 n=1 Tax=Saccharopolyspora gloriosae TaxID=455344 RepID=A0A840NES4_9PSEU|nr:luciferase family oxidoreductase group 1 [Saccharopolyspora gloriosae]
MTTPHVPLNVLDLVSVSDGSTMADAIASSMAAAELADELGYSRVWYAEHHNTQYLGATATALLIAQAAGRTERIRVGSGGIMLPNHAPLQVAESFGTLAQLHPGRIDLGLGRAPGTDQLTAQLLNRSGSDAQSFANSLYDLTGWFGDEGRAHSAPVTAGPATGTHVPLWVLGSTVNGASIAGQLGLPFAVASHFAPAGLDEILDVYRSSFSTEAPTAQLTEPRVMVGVNVVVAPTDEEATRLWTTAQRMFLDVRSGNRRGLQPPTEPEEVGGEHERRFADSMLSINAIGSPATAVRELEALVDRTGADELITVTYCHDPADRLRSLKLLAGSWF